VLKLLRELEIMELKAQRNAAATPPGTLMLKQSSYNDMRSRLEVLVADNESMRSLLAGLIPALRRLQVGGPASTAAHVPGGSPQAAQYAQQSQGFRSSPLKLSARLIPQGFAQQQQQQPTLRASGPVPSTQPPHPLPSTSATLRLSRSSTNGVGGTNSMRNSSSAMPLNAQGYFMA
jgi:hypothetical protein